MGIDDLNINDNGGLEPNDRMDGLWNLLNNMFNNNSKGFKDNSENPINFNDIEADLGKPTRIRTFTENGFTFEEKTWQTESGMYVSVEMIESPMNKKSKPLFKEKSLVEQLKDALDDENYELAAKLRDNIKNNSSDNQTTNTNIKK